VANALDSDQPAPKPIKWLDKPAGQWSGIDYSANGAQGLDPYFVWADMNGLAHLRQRGHKAVQPAYLPVLLQLAQGRHVNELPLEKLDNTEQPLIVVEQAYMSERLLRPGGALPMYVRPEFLRELGPGGSLEEVVAYCELDVTSASVPMFSGGEKSLSKNMRGAASPLAKNSNQGSPKPLKGKVVALIDDGCAFAHSRFYSGNPSNPNSLKLRVKRLWDMNERAARSPHAPPALFAVEAYPGANGREFTDGDLKAIITTNVVNGRVDEDAVYAALAAGSLHKVNRLRKPWAHGMHVMDLACGPYFAYDRMCTRTLAPSENPEWAPIQDDASEADIIFVQLPMRTVQDSTLRGTMQQDVIKAMDYIISQCAPDAEIFVNLSWGTLAGPHTGTNLLEREIDARIAASGGKLHVVVPAGNGRQSRTHAHFELAPQNAPDSKDRETLHWRTQPDDQTESYLELWLEQGGQVEIDITTPSGVALPTLKQGDVKFLNYSGAVNWPVAQPDVVLAAVYSSALQGGAGLGPGPGVVLALAPTHSRDQVRGTAMHGIWKVTVRNVKSSSLVADAYIERDDTAADTRKGARQSYFDDPNYDIHALEDGETVSDTSDPAQAYVRREGGFNSIATGQHTKKVGGVRMSDLEVAEYSPHHEYSGRTQRNQTLIERDKAISPLTELVYAVCEESRTLHGVRAAGTRSGGTMRLMGTSMAAPLIARDLVNHL
jgi:hypothetical protein